MKISPGITNQLTFSKIHEGMNKTPVANKHMDKSLRLIHRTQDKVNFDELKVHTSISRLIGKDRGTKRTDALDLIKNSLAEEFKGNPGQANSILQRVGLAGKDRITMRQLNALKTEVDQQKKINASIGTILKKVLEKDGSGISNQEFKEALATLAGTGLSKEQLKLKIDLSNLPLISKLLGSLNEEPLARQAAKMAGGALDDLALEKYKNLRPENMDVSIFNTLMATTLTLVGTLKDNINDKANQLLNTAFEKDGNAQVSNKIQEFKNLRTHPKDVPPLSNQEKTELRNEGIGKLLDQGQWTIAEGGSGGAMIVRDPQSPTGGAVIKLEETERTENAVQVTELFDAISDSPELISPMPFDFAGAYRVDVQNDGTLGNFKEKLSNIKEETQGRSHNNAQRHAVNIESEKFSMSKLPLVNGTEVNKFSATERLALLKSPDFAKDLGKVMVIGRLMGLNDHVSMNGIQINDSNDKGNAVGRNNISNLMINKDTGRLVLIDPSVDSDKEGINEENQQYRTGFLDHTTLTLIGNAKQYMINNLDTAVKIQQEMEEALNMEGTATPVSRLVQDVFFAQDDDSMIGPHESYLMDKLSDKERQHFVANLYLGIAEGLKYVKTNETAFIEGGTQMKGKFMSDPEKLITGITSDLDQLDTAIDELGKYLLN